MAPLRLGRTDPTTTPIHTPIHTPAAATAQTTAQTTAPAGLPVAFSRTLQTAANRRCPVPPGLILRAPDLSDLRPGDLGPGGYGPGGYGPGTLVDLRGPALRDRPAPALTLAAARSALPDRWTGDGLLLTRAVPAVHGGTARLRPEQPCDEVAAFEVTAAGRASGEAARTLLVPRLGRLQRAHRGGDAWRTPLPPWGMRLARLLRAVRPLADGGAVEWADDGHRCWLLLVHPAD